MKLTPKQTLRLKKNIQWQGAFLVLQVFNFFSLYSSNLFS